MQEIFISGHDRSHQPDVLFCDEGQSSRSSVELINGQCVEKLLSS